eukprot:gene58820-80554_t
MSTRGARRLEGIESRARLAALQGRLRRATGRGVGRGVR